MTRVLKKPEERRNEILDAARSLFMTRGYDATTVNDIIDAVKLSKGAFYHHFTAKTDVLDALVQRMADEGLRGALPILERADLSPIERLDALFRGGGQYKKENAAVLRALVSVMYREENLKLRLRATEAMIDRITPPLGALLAEGKATGVFDVDDPVETARLVMNVSRLIHDAFSAALGYPPDRRAEAVAQCRARISACERAIERVLGIPRQSLTIVDPEAIEPFLDLLPAGNSAQGADR